MTPSNLVNLGSLPRSAILAAGRFVAFTTPRKPGQVYVIDQETGVQYRLETARRRWPQYFNKNTGRPK